MIVSLKSYAMCNVKCLEISSFIDRDFLCIWILSWWSKIKSVISFFVPIFKNPFRANIAAAAGGIIFFMLYLPYSFMVVWEEALDPRAKTFSVIYFFHVLIIFILFFSASSPTLRLVLAAPTSPTMRRQVWGPSGTTSGWALWMGIASVWVAAWSSWRWTPSSTPSSCGTLRRCSLASTGCPSPSTSSSPRPTGQADLAPVWWVLTVTLSMRWGWLVWPVAIMNLSLLTSH